VLVAPDPDRALDELVAAIYGEWEDNETALTKRYTHGR
jgi:hypothetical protein